MNMNLLNTILIDAEYHGENAGNCDGQYGVLSATGRHLGLDWTYDYVERLVYVTDAEAWDQMTTAEQADLVSAYLEGYAAAYLTAWETELEAFLADA